MSGSFWKFGQDYTTESSISKLLNKAFIKIGSSDISKLDDVSQHNDESSLLSGKKENVEDQITSAELGDYDDEKDESKLNEEFTNEDINEFPSDEEFYVNYKPNLDVLTDLLDDEELYTELMCSNFKLLIYLKYPEVLEKLIEYVITENFAQPSDEEVKDVNSLLGIVEVENNETEKEEKMNGTATVDDSNKEDNDSGTIASSKTTDNAVEKPNKDEDEKPESEIKEEAEHDIEDKENTLEEHDSLKTVIVDSNEGNIPGIDAEERVNNDSDNNSDTSNEDDSTSDISEETSVTIPPESKEQAESRRAHMAAEVLSADVWPISSALVENHRLMEKIWSLLDNSAPLSVETSTYFMKINERLLDMDLRKMLEFILKQKSLVERFLIHIDNPPLMDFLLKVISTDKPESPVGILQVLKDQKLISKLLDHLKPEVSASTQAATGDFLKALVTLSANSNNDLASCIGPNELTRELVSKSMMEKMIGIMLEGDTSLNNGVGIIIELIRKNNSDYDFEQVIDTTLETHPPNERDPIYLGYMIDAFATHLPAFHEMLIHSDLKEMKTTFGSIMPLGFERFKICELIAELLHCSNMALLNELEGKHIVLERDRVREQNIAEKKNANLDELADVTLNDDMAEEISNLKLTDDNETKESEATKVDDANKLDDTDSVVVGDNLKQVLHENGIIITILNMFFKFPWNNFLHNVVFDIVQQILNGPVKASYNKYLLSDLFIKATITQMIIDGEKRCTKEEVETGLRLGYMGHLVLIAEEVVKFDQYIKELGDDYDDEEIINALKNSNWEEYTNNELAQIREKYNTVLGDFDNEDGADSSLKEDGLFANDGDEEPLSDENQDSPNLLPGLDNYQTYQADDDDEYFAEYNDTDSSRYYEYIDANGNRTKIHLNTPLDYSSISNEESDSFDLNNEDRFSDYMSQEIGNDFNPYGYEPVEEEEDNEHDQGEDLGDNYKSNDYKTGGATWYSNEFKSVQPREGLDGDALYKPLKLDIDEDDDYLDPNDDGQSYAKPNHPLYSNSLSSTTDAFANELQDHHDSPEETASGNDSSSDDIDDEEEDDDDEDSGSFKDNDEIKDRGEITTDIAYVDDQDKDNYALCRSRSNDTPTWDEDEQNRLMEMVNYNRKFAHGR